jgi:hypothetical protein
MCLAVLWLDISDSEDRTASIFMVEVHFNHQFTRRNKPENHEL